VTSFKLCVFCISEILIDIDRLSSLTLTSMPLFCLRLNEGADEDVAAFATVTCAYDAHVVPKCQPHRKLFCENRLARRCSGVPENRCGPRGQIAVQGQSPAACAVPSRTLARSKRAWGTGNESDITVLEGLARASSMRSKR
jgi:hypothetical protein